MHISLPDWVKHSPYNRYFDFIAMNIDRYKLLLETIDSFKLNSAVIPIAGNRHIFIFPARQKLLRGSENKFPFSGKSPFVLTAHYDRVAGSAGANDNSIAVFHLLKVALTFYKQNIDNWMIIFTDKEELNPGESFDAQGSYTLEKKIKIWGLEKAKIFNFDSCGSGNTFLFSTTTDHLLKNANLPNIQKTRNAILHLRDHALTTGNNLRLEKVLLGPAPFSDDAGFLRAGVAALTITVLPANEAEKYERLLHNRPDFADIIISGKSKELHEFRNLPETWRTLNSSADTPSRLTPEYFYLVVDFMMELCR